VTAEEKQKKNIPTPKRARARPEAATACKDDLGVRAGLFIESAATKG